MMSTAGSPPARCGRPTHLRRRHPLMPPPPLLLLASAFCWKGAAAQIGCYDNGNIYIRYSATTENFFEALSGDGVDFYQVRAPRIYVWMLLFPTTRRCQTPRPPSVHRSFFFSPSPEFIFPKKKKNTRTPSYAGVHHGVWGRHFAGTVTEGPLPPIPEPRSWPYSRLFHIFINI